MQFLFLIPADPRAAAALAEMAEPADTGAPTGSVSPCLPADSRLNIPKIRADVFCRQCGSDMVPDRNGWCCLDCGATDGLVFDGTCGTCWMADAAVSRLPNGQHMALCHDCREDLGAVAL